MKYIVQEVSGIFPANFGQQRVNFTVQGNPNKISGFFKDVPMPGAEIEGEIIQKGQYWNFVVPKRPAFQAPAQQESSDLLQKIYREAYATRQNLQILVQRLENKGVLDNINEPQNTRVIYPPSQGPTAFDEEQPFP